MEPGNLETFASELTEYAYELGPIGAYRQIGNQSRNPHNYNAIYWNPERLVKLDSGGFWLSETPDRPSQDWGANLVTSANWIRFSLSDSTRILVLNTHLDIGPMKVRSNSVRLILQQIESLRLNHEPVIICGDFNAIPGDEPYELLAQAGCRDVFRDLGNVEEPQAFTAHMF